MFRDEAILEVKEQEPDFLEEAYNRATRQYNYVCPACGNGSGENGTGLVKYEKDGCYHCFVCNSHMDVFELAQKEKGFADFVETALWLFDYYKIEDFEEDNENWKRIRKKADKKKKPILPEEKAYYTSYIKKTQETPDYSYLLSRGISIETQKRFGVGYDGNFISPKILFLQKDTSHITPTRRCIIPTSDYTAVARDIRSNDEIPELQKAYKNMKFGPVHFFNFDSLKSNPQYTFVVEGEIDALSLIECGFNAVALGSASNVEAFIEALGENHSSVKYFIVIGDKDNAGKDMGKKLVSKLKREYLCLDAYNIELPQGIDCKDVNDFLQKDRKGFVKWINHILKEVCFISQVAISKDKMIKLYELLKDKNIQISDYIESLIEERWDEKEKENETFYER